jgi:hypothetical protein
MRILLAVLFTASLMAACADDDTTETGPGATAPPPEDTVPTEETCIPEPAEQPRPDYLGLTQDEAAEQAAQEGLQFRVVGEDGECFPITADLRPDRVNVHLEGGVVADAAIF